MDPTQNAAFILFATLAPLLIALLKQSGFDTKWNALIALGGYVIVGIAGAVVAGQELTVENAVMFVTVATLVGTAAYNLFWKHWGDDQITAATSLIKA